MDDIKTTSSAHSWDVFWEIIDKNVEKVWVENVSLSNSSCTLYEVTELPIFIYASLCFTVH